MRNLKDYLCKSGSELGGKSSAAVPMLGAGLSLYSASSALPDLMMLDKATQAQRGGAGKLTPQSEGEAQFNLYMGYTNLLLAGMDAGAHKVAFNVAKGVGNKGLQALSKLDRTAIEKLLLNARALRSGMSPEMVQVTDALRQATGNDKKLYQQLLDAFKKARDKFPPSGGGSPELATATAGGSSRASASLDKVGSHQPMKSQGTGGARTVANPNISAEVAAKWSKTKNWNEVESFIGQQAGDKLPPGYNYSHDGRVVNRANGRGTDAEMVPLQIAEDGTFQITTQVSNRISVARVMKKNFDKAYGVLKEGYQIHHLIPDGVMRNNQLAKFSRQLGYDLDNADNLLGLANKEKWTQIQKKPLKASTGEGYSDKVGHWSNHKEYSGQVNTYLNDRFSELKREFGDLNQALKDPIKKKQLIQEVDQVMKNAETHFRNLIEQGKAPHKPDGRISWNNGQNEPTA
jgi:A nuclease family of the HNH/ENDO VII superfamily with conserved AHH